MHLTVARSREVSFEIMCSAAQHMQCGRCASTTRTVSKCCLLLYIIIIKCIWYQVSCCSRDQYPTQSMHHLLLPVLLLVVISCLYTQFITVLCQVGPLGMPLRHPVTQSDSNHAMHVLTISLHSVASNHVQQNAWEYGKLHVKAIWLPPSKPAPPLLPPLLLLWCRFPWMARYDSNQMLEFP